MSEHQPEVLAPIDEVLGILGRIMGEKSPQEWLVTPNKAFSGKRPIDIIDGSDEQAREELIQMLRDFDKLEPELRKRDRREHR
jgi:hypothetical protein